MTRYRVSELSDELLDLAVAKALGRDDIIASFTHGVGWSTVTDSEWSPSSNWAIGGLIIEQAKIDTGHASNAGEPLDDGEWIAYAPTREGVNRFTADDPLTAAMRAFVGARLGDVVDLGA